MNPCRQLLRPAVLAFLLAAMLAPSLVTSGQEEEPVIDEGVIPNEIIVRFHENRTDRAFESQLLSVSGAVEKREYPFISHIATLVFPEGVTSSRS